MVAVAAGALLASLTTPQEEGTETRLQRLLMPSVDPSSLRYIPLLLRLQTLQLSVDGGEAELVTLYTCLVSTRLPLLRHLHMSGGPWSSGRCTALTAFIAAYAGQLLTLNLDCDPYYNTEAVDASHPASDREALTAALLSCRSLRRLQVNARWRSSSVPAALLPALPHLESLHLDVMGAADEATLWQCCSTLRLTCRS